MSDLIVNVKYTQRMRIVASLTREKKTKHVALPILAHSITLRPLIEAEDQFRKLYMEIAIRQSGSIKKAAVILQVHRNLISNTLHGRGRDYSMFRKRGTRGDKGERE